MARQSAPTLEQQQFSDSLVTAVEGDDLAFALYWAEHLLKSGGVVEWPSSSTKLTPLQTAVSTRGRERVRKVIVEVLLLSGATLDASSIKLAEQSGNQEVVDTLQQWNKGGRAKATLASEFLQLGAHPAEERIFHEGLGVEDTEEASAEQQVSVAQDSDMDLGMPDEDRKPDPALLPRGPEPLDSTTSPAPNAEADSSRQPSPSIAPTPSRPPSPFVPHRLCISNIDITMTEAALVDILTRVGGRIGSTRLLTTNATPPTQTAYIDVGSSEARERIKKSWDGTHVNGRPLQVVFVEDQSRRVARGRSRSRSPARTRDTYEDRQAEWRRAPDRPSYRRQRSPSPRRRSRSRPPPRQSDSRRSTISSRRRSPSPHSRRRSPSPPPRRRSLSPHRSAGPSRRRSPSPRRRPRSPSPRHRRRSPLPAARPSPNKARSIDDLRPVFVAGIPPSMAERQLYDLASAVVVVDHVRLRHGVTDIRYGFVVVLSWADHDLLIDHIRRTTFTQAPELSARPLTGKSPTQSERERPYRTMNLNMEPPADNIPAELHLTHLPPHASSKDVAELFESVHLQPRHVEVKDSVSSTVPHAFVTLSHHRDCIEAIRRLDGELMRNSALCVEWSIPRGFQPPQSDRPPSPLRRPRSPSPRRRDAPPRRRPLSPVRRDSSPTTDQSSTTYSPARLAINRLPDFMAERQLWELVARHAEVSDVHVLHNKTARFAFVDLERHSDVAKVIKALDDHQVGPTDRISVNAYLPGRGAPARPLHHSNRLPYRGPAHNSRPPANLPAPRLFFAHLPVDLNEGEFGSFLRGYSFAFNRIKIVTTPQRTTCSYVDFESVEVCREALQAFDGAVLRGKAMLVVWVIGEDPNPSRRESLRAVSKSPSARASRSSPAFTAPQRPFSRPPSPTPTAPLSSLDLSAEAALARDVSRIECLNLSREDVELIQQVWKPLSHPPTNDFTRSVEISTSFGYFSPSEAKAALQLPPLYDDPAKQARYEMFLQSQLGDSRDRYLTFLAQLAQFNSSNREFAAFAQDVARVASPPPLPQPQYDPDQDYTVAAAEFGPSAPPRERKRSFEVSSRVERAFSR